MSGRIAIVGGGVTGLAAAYDLAKALGPGDGVAVTLYERSERLGGKVVTEHVDGFVIEGGPDSFLTTKPWAVELCRELGLGERLVPTRGAGQVFLLVGGRLEPLPAGLRLVTPTRLLPFLASGVLSWRGKARMAAELLLPRRGAAGDESIGAFVGRRLGREAAERLGQPLLAGIHIGDADRLSLAATFPQLAELEQRHRSLLLGAWRSARAARRGPPGGSGPALFVAPEGGTQELTAALEAELAPRGVLRPGSDVLAVRPAAGGYEIALGDRNEQADAVVLAVPGPVAGRLLFGAEPGLAAGLGAIRHLSSATVSLGYRRRDVRHPLDGFGFVVAPGEPVRLRACTWTSSKLPHRAPPDAVLLRCFVGGEGREDDVALDDGAIVRLVREDLGAVMGLDAEPVVSRVFRWPGANPQYDVGHLERIAGLERACPPGLFLGGSSYHGVGVPDCVRSGRAAASAALAHLRGRGGP
jgi:oxygen-dependent protoporphyrinogen oxidase